MEKVNPQGNLIQNPEPKRPAEPGVELFLQGGDDGKGDCGSVNAAPFTVPPVYWRLKTEQALELGKQVGDNPQTQRQKGISLNDTAGKKKVGEISVPHASCPGIKCSLIVV